MRHAVVRVLAVLTVFVVPDVGEAAPSQCDAARIQAAGKLIKLSLVCHAKGAQKGDAAAGECLTKARDTFAGLYDKGAKHGDCSEPALTTDEVVGTAGQGSASIVASLRPQQDANPCAAFKLKSTGVAVLAAGKCEALAAKKDLPLDAQCIDKVYAKPAAAFAKAEAKKGPCFTSGDATSTFDDTVSHIQDLSVLIAVDPTPTATGTATPTGTMTRTLTPVVTGTATPTGTATATPVIPCSASAPACGGACSIPAQFCEPNGGGGCTCMAVISP